MTLPVNVLVVDDEDAIVSEITEFFSRVGIRVTAASDASDATRRFAAAGEGMFTVVVTDIGMPGQSGLSLAQDIMATCPEAAAVEIIIMTGHSNHGTVQEVLRARAFEFFKKPFHLAKLAESVRLAHSVAVARRRRHLAATAMPETCTGGARQPWDASNGPVK